MSDEQARITRPFPERDRANRAPNRLFPPRRDEPTDESPPPEAEAARDPVSRAVDLGYTVIDDFLRRGAQSAEETRSRAREPRYAGGDLREMTERMFQYFSEAGMIWMEIYGGIARTGGATATRDTGASPGAGAAREESTEPSPPAADAPTHTSTATAATAATVMVPILMASKRPVEVALSLQQSCDLESLRVHDLRAAPGKPRLRGIGFESGSEHSGPRLEVRVPDDQPAGAYHGVILDERSNRPAGTLSVIVLDKKSGKRSDKKS